ncbi:alpha/beta hydrolase [Natronobacterium texcoconense]|uniref:Dienelactone hydrolase n=1 Tax=Natronobacterium texcoconense TaxID=1095778 RepID=A0A1H1J561_NATTX|nr:acyl-CoA thioester hydrolase/BAAT C-terminal domain-containing protein [Natronobacterium texcoconense]SDR45091.1 Dienelactone hydrolase [Natronobacterium texcoconense]
MTGPRRTRRRTLALLGSCSSIALAGCSTDDDLSPSFDHPDRVRVDEPFEMEVTGVPAETDLEVVLEGDITDYEPFGAAVTLETDGETLDVNEAPIVDGDVPPELEVPTTVALIQFADVSWWEFHRDSPEPPVAFQWPDERTLQFSVRVDGEELGSTTIERHYPDLEADAEPDGDLVGSVFEPDDAAESPGIVVLHGSGGGSLDYVAAQLAQRGFTTLSLEYFDGPGLPDDLVEIPLEYVERAIDWLLEYDGVTGDRVGLWGVSKGSELALLAGSELDSIGPVVSIAGSGVVWEGGSSADDLPETSSWSIDGDPVPYVSLSDVPREPGTPLVDRFSEALETAASDTIEDATIPVEEIHGPVLLVSGGDDGLWPAERLHEFSADRLEEADDSSFDHLVYDDAGHSILQPYFPSDGTYGLGYGGSHTGNAEAAHDHWPAVLDAFETLE